MVHPFSSISTFEGNDLEDYLKKIHIIDIFRDIFIYFPEHAAKVVRFIIYAYSAESDMLYVDGITWSILSEKILSRVGLDREIIDVDMIMERDCVLSSIQGWLKFQNDENFTQVCMLRDLRRDFLKIAATQVSNKITSLDDAARLKSLVEAKMSAAKYSKELYEMMKESQSTFIQNHDRLKISMSALNKALAEKKTANIEDFI